MNPVRTGASRTGASRSGASRHAAVIGAGVLGASVATRLAEDGWRVTLLEADRPGRGASRWSFAWLNANAKSPRAYHDLNDAGIKAWAGLAPSLDGRAWYRPSGNVELATSLAGADELNARVRRLTDWGYDARLVDPPEAAQREPSLKLNPAPTAAAFFPGEGYLLTEPLIERLVARAAALGAQVRTGDAGRVTALVAGLAGTRRVRTADGAELDADEVVCCAGRWTPALAELAGGTSPVPLAGWTEPGATAPGLVVRAGPVGEDAPARLVHTPEICLRPHTGALVHLEAPDVHVDLHTPDAELHGWAGELLRRARAAVRGLDQAEVTDYHVCVRPMPADGQSIVGRLPGPFGLYVAVTHSGVTLGAHLARLITADLAGHAPAGLAPYRPGRFDARAAAS